MNTRANSKRHKASSLFDTNVAEDPTILSVTTSSISDPAFPRFASDHYSSDNTSANIPSDHASITPRSDHVSINLDSVHSDSGEATIRGSDPVPTASLGMREEDLTSITSRARELSVDPNTLLLFRCLSKQESFPSVERSNPNDTDKLVKLIGIMGENEDIMVFLNRFETELGSRHIPLTNFRLYLPYCLSGPFKEAYYNNISLCPTYADARIVLLNTGGYSLTECLNSFPLKFRYSGSKTLIQWYNHWRYKINILISNLPFSNSMHPKVRDEVADMVATIGLVAGLPQDHREAVLNRPTLSNAHFVQDCNAWYLSSHQSHSKAPHKFHNSQSYNSFQPNYRSVCSSQIGNTNSTPHYSGQTSQQPNQNPYQHPNQHSLSPSFNPRPQRTPQPRRDLASVTCFKCNRLGHYANTCPSHPTPSVTWQSNNTQAPTPQPNAVPNSPPTQPVAQTPTRPSPVPRNNSRPVRLINTSNLSEPESFVEPDIPQLLGSVHNDPPLNHFEEDDLITYGKINGIDTPIIIDSGAKVSVISDDFVELDMEPVHFVPIYGISQEIKTVPVFAMSISVPTLEGECFLAMDSRLPPKTVLLGLDFGTENIVKLINHAKSGPQPVLTVTRAMQADSDLAAHTSEVLHCTEGASPTSFDSIQEAQEEVDSSSRPSDNPGLVPMSFPNLSFDGLNKQEFAALQRSDPSLTPLWEFACKGEKQFFVVDNLLMCITSTLNSVSHALVVPTSLRRKVLVAAHEGLGHGGVNTTRSLINRHFTWPNLAADIKQHVMSCVKCSMHNKSGGKKVPMIQPEIISQRCEKLAFDIVGPLPTSKQKFRFILTCLEMASGFPFAVPLKSYTSEETARAILSVVSFLGTPLTILTDQGTNFMSVTLSHLKKKLHMASIRTSAYHPQSNGRLERFHSTLKAMLAKCIQNKQDWPLALDLVLYYARNVPNSRHGFTPHELLFVKPTPFILSTLKSLWTTPSDSSLNLPQFIEDLDKVISCQTHFVKESLSSKSLSDRVSSESALVSNYKLGDTVYKRNPGHNKCLEASWDGPFTIKSLLPPVNCAIVPVNKKAKPKVVHLSQIKKVLHVYKVLLVPEESVCDEFVQPINTSEPISLSLEQQSQLDSVLGHFPSVFSNKPGRTSLVQHSISVSTSTPLWSPSYSIPLSYQEAFRLEIENMISLGVIEPSTSKWSSPPLPVRKKDGGIRIVIDFRKLNSVTVREPFTMPSIDDIISHLGEATILSKLDLLKGFYQVPMDEVSKQYTAFTCLQGKFQFKVMPFGLTNAPSTFQLLMQSVLRGLEPFCLPYIDDLVIFSTSFDQHLAHITSVLSRLELAGLTVKQEKCSWCFASFDFLGFHVGHNRLSIPSTKVSTISSYQLPLTKSSLRSFLGLITFYSRFIPLLSQHTSVLNCHMTKDSPDNILCDDDYDKAFRSIIYAISHHSSLIIPSTNDALCVFTDASFSGVGGTLCVYRNSDWIPAEFYSRQLSKAEKNYSILDLEAAALLATVERFRFHLAGKFFKVFTDHRPLVNIINGQAPSSRLTRWKIRLLEYTFEIQHIDGSGNKVADAMSRQSWPSDD